MASNAQVLEEQAIGYARRGDFGVAARDANDELTRLSPGNAGAWTRLARCCLELGQLEQATAALDAALQLNPQNTIARNLQAEVERRRQPAPVPKPRPVRRAPPQPPTRATRTRTAGSPVLPFDRGVFTTLGHLPPPAALEALAPRLEPILMELNDRAFAQKVVEARNRAAQPGGALYRRNNLYATGPGHIQAVHYGGRWEPQINIGLFAAPHWERDGVRAGIGFDLSASGTDPDPQAGQLRALAYFEAFQRLAGTSWRQLLATWMSANGGFIQHGANPPATNVLPSDAIAWLVNVQNPIETGWIFCGRWLFADRAEHAAILSDGRQLLTWLDQTFTDLLPLWTSVYRG
jgi:tetratricopeptide (TPR) repeat protein